jgi:hypothetical protein
MADESWPSVRKSRLRAEEIDMSQEPETSAVAAEASAELDKIIAELGPERAREIFELAMTELITEQDPEHQHSTE